MLPMGSLELLAYKKLPDGCAVTWNGLAPAANGEPGTEVSAPVLGSRVNAKTPFRFAWARNRNLPAESIAMPAGPLPLPTGNGEPLIGASPPVAALIANPSIAAPVKSDTYKNLARGSATMPPASLGPGTFVGAESAPLVRSTLNPAI